MDDIIFILWTNDGVSLPQQRRAQANVPAALYLLRPVLSDGGRQDWTSTMCKGCRGKVGDAPFPGQVIISAVLGNKKHLNKVGPIRHCEPFYIAIHQVSLLSHAACESMSTTTTTTTTTTRDIGDRYGPMEWAQLSACGGRDYCRAKQCHTF